MSVFRGYSTLPPLPAAGPLERYREQLGVIVPVARTNLITNPSLETNTTGWTAVGGSIAQSAAQQYHGVYSLAVTPGAGTTDGAYFGTVSLTASTTYAVSIKVLGVPGVPYKLSVATTGGVDLVTRAFTGTGRWQWLWLFWTETSTTTRRVSVTKNTSTNTGVFYVDGAQVEACGAEGVFVTTYIDGDQVGYVANQSPPAYVWAGIPHASTSSRSGQTRAGGRIVRFQDLGFLLTAIIGLGLAAPRNEVLGFAQLDGAQYHNTIKPQRNVSFVGRWVADDPSEMDMGVAQLGRLIDRDRIGLRQELALCLQALDCGQAIGEPLTIPRAVYQGGLEGNTQELPTAAANITFTQNLPFVIARDGGAALDVQDSISTFYMALRDPAGRWTALGSDITSVGIGGTNIRAAIFAPDGYLYVGGDVGQIGGIANTIGIARYHVATGVWSAVGTGGAASAIVTGLALDPAGNVYAIGDWTAMGGAATSADAAVYNITTNTWTGLNRPGAVTAFFAVAVAPGGTAYFLDSVGNLRSYVPATGTWAVVGTAAGGSAIGLTLAIGLNGDLYIGGNYTSFGGVASTNIIKYTIGTNPSAPAFVAVPSLSVAINSMVFGLDGALYATNTTASSQLSRLRGQAWEAIGPVLPTSSAAFCSALGPDGLIYFGGTFTMIDTVTLPDSVAAWNGSTGVALDINFPTALTDDVSALATRADGYLFVGRRNNDTVNPPSTGTATTAGLATVTNSGTAAAYPTLTIRGPSTGSSRIYQIINKTTGVAIYLNYTISAGETAVLTLDPTNLSFVSNFRGNIYNTILSGSQAALFVLQPGANSISFYSADATVTATLSWATRYLSLSDALYQSVDA